MAFTQDNSLNQDEDNQQGVIATGGGQQSLAQGGLAGSTAAQGINPQKQGSGRFTNLNKYVQANQQGAQNMAQRVGTGIQTQLDAKQRDVTTGYGDVNKSVTAGQGTLGTAKTEQDKLSNIAEQFKPGFQRILNSDRGQFGEAQTQAQQFVKNNPNYQTFKNVQAGQGVDETALQNQFSNVQNTGNLYQNLFNKRQGQIGTTAGRSEALGEFIGGQNQAVRPTYSKGQRGLDNLILGQSTPALQGLINKVGANKTNVDSVLGQVVNTGTSLNDLIKQESDLMSNIDTTAQSAQSGFQGAFDQNKLNEINNTRAVRFKNESLNLAEGKVSKDLFAKLFPKGAPSDMSYYNALTNKDLGTSGLSNDYFTRKADVLDTGQLGNENDISTDAALADILGASAKRKFTNVGDLSTDVNLRQGDDGGSLLANAIKSQQDQYGDAFNTFTDTGQTTVKSGAVGSINGADNIRGMTPAEIEAGIGRYGNLLKDPNYRNRANAENSKKALEASLTDWKKRYGHGKKLITTD